MSALGGSSPLKGRGTVRTEQIQPGQQKAQGVPTRRRAGQTDETLWWLMPGSAPARTLGAPGSEPPPPDGPGPEILEPHGACRRRSEVAGRPCPAPSDTNPAGAKRTDSPLHPEAFRPAGLIRKGGFGGGKSLGGEGPRCVDPAPERPPYGRVKRALGIMAWMPFTPSTS